MLPSGIRLAWSAMPTHLRRFGACLVLLAFIGCSDVKEPPTQVAIRGGGPSFTLQSLDLPLHDTLAAQQQWDATLLWNATETWNATIADNERRAENERQPAERVTSPTRKESRPVLSKPPPAPSSATSGRCGGDLPPCWVMNRESGGDIHAYNPTGCGGRGCRGKWQCDPRSCRGTGTEAEQDAEARALWAGGRGCGNWAAC